MPHKPEPPKKGKPRRLCSRVRAMLDQDKESRLKDFLNSASGLFDRNDYDSITVSDICKSAGLAKGTFYLYVDTKEEAFLALTRQQVLVWSQLLDAKFAALGVKPDAIKVAKVLGRSFAEVPQLPRLLQMLHNVLEVNVSEESITAFKREVASANDTHGEVVGKMYPQLSAAQIQLFLLFCHIALTGTWQIANPPAKVRSILERNDLQRFLFDFETALTQQVVVFLKGLSIT